MKKGKQASARNVLPDCIIPAVALVFAIYYLTTITEVPWISQASAIFVSCLLLLSIIAFVIRTVWRIRQRRETLRLQGSFQDLFGTMPTSARRIALLALVIAYVLVIETLGFSLTTFVFVFVAIVLLSSLANWKKSLVIALSCSIIGYIVFIYFFKTRFPTGPIEDWLKGVI
ncbi:MAG TPA: tripartite tricarboxylate transporter TctB family protein [Gammaproteobacteria bacterium]|nr:tripartite tricarboxylate transporter TctB family protein [Gammaproteobacteria bacterium]